VKRLLYVFMTATPVESKTLATIAYDPADRVLRLAFRTGAVYCYFAVPPDVHRDLIAADSKGSYFNRAIRGRYLYQRLADGKHFK
jgi:hypothetical protein